MCKVIIINNNNNNNYYYNNDNNNNNNIKNDQASLLPNCGIVNIKIRESELINVSISRMKENVREIKEKKIRKRNQH